MARSASGRLASPGPEELHEPADDTALAQHLGDRQHEIGGGRALLEIPAEPEAEHLGNQHRHRLAEHRRLSLDPADAPAEDAEPVDHRRVRIGADQRVGIGQATLLVDEHHPRQVLQVDLVDDAGVRRHNREVVKCLLAPAQERVALLIALELQLGVAPERLLGPVDVDLHRVVDHQLGWDQRVDLRRIATHRADRVAHRGQVDDAGNAGEVLHDHARGSERDLLAGLVLGVPGGQRLDVLGADRLAVLVAEQVLEQDLERERQPRDVELGLKCVEAEDLVVTLAHRQAGLGVKAVVAHIVLLIRGPCNCNAGRHRPEWRLGGAWRGLLRNSYRRLRSTFRRGTILLRSRPPGSEGDTMTFLIRTTAGLTLGAAGTLLAAALYTEAHRAPDQS